jgi:hypothetical protein
MTLLDNSTPRSLASEKSRDWQRRRSELLQAACTEIAALSKAGVAVTRAIKDIAKKFRSRSLGGGCKLALSETTMIRLWYRWRGSQSESEFALHYVAGRTVDIDPLLLRLIIESSIRSSKSVSKILVELGGDNRSVLATLRTIYRALPIGALSQFLRAERRLITRRKAAELKLSAIESTLRNLRAAAEASFLFGKESAQ